MEDRISELPISTLHHILCFLSQKEAVRTCLLSKQWRHVGSTRPNLDFSEEWFGFEDTEEKVVSVNCSIRHRVLSLLSRPWRHKGSTTRPNLDTMRQNFVSIVDRTLQGYHDQNISIDKLHLHLSTGPRSSPVISLLKKWPPMIPALNIKAFKFNVISPTFHLSLTNVCYESLEELHLRKCDLSRVQSVRIKRLRALTRLSLDRVILSSGTFDLLSFGCPTLESLTLDNCSGFEEFNLASDSVKFLSISVGKILLKGATICAPNIVRFNFNADIPQVPDTFSFTTTTSKVWSSEVFLSSHKDDPDVDLNSWFIKLRRVLKALSESRISLFLQMDCGPRDVPCSAVLGDEPPVVVRDLIFATRKSRTTSWYLGFTNGLFHVCRPSLVRCCRLVSKSDKNYRLSKFQFNILLAKKSLRTEPCFWQHDLEQVFVEGLDGRQWQLVQWKMLGSLRKRTQDRNICLRLKWRC